MSVENVNKFKAMLKVKAEAFAEKAGQKMGEAAFEAKKAMDAVTPLARSTLVDIGKTLNSAHASFQQALSQAETKAREKLDQEERTKAHEAGAAAAKKRETPPPASGSGSA